ncbi:uncharacterized protein LOC107024174 isoform X1 [Solanum pennellii]|uniref:Uncharacterized protein LOC107024174 isoform X1 n=1 Tax=Solanum pennellii TaxID=28526 RepID=A0ABM1VE40_SOLPN|nr:uncharacterized protein LOC107024174 isoform X1 [Solanum pennellii]XP_027774008.1 uncharacterized protein LOC107024174 isoform X1 [Solanum pennellii]
MGVEPQKDQPKEMDWKTLGGTGSSEANVGPAVKKRLPKRIRQVPEYYFLPRRSLPYSIAFYGSFIAAGVGAGMLLEAWINKKRMEESFGSSTSERCVLFMFGLLPLLPQGVH